MNEPQVSVVKSNCRRLTPLVLWLFFNNPNILSQDIRDDLRKKQEEDKDDLSRIKKGSLYPERMRIFCFDILCKSVLSKVPIILEGPNRITFDIISESLEHVADNWKERNYIQCRHGISFLFKIHGSGWTNTDIFHKKHFYDEDQKFRPTSRSIVEASSQKKIFNQIERSYAAACVATAHGPTQLPHRDHFTQAYFTSHGSTPPRPSLLDFIAKCASEKLQEDIQKNPLLKSSYQSIERSMDETALVAVGMIAEECLVASLLPFARAHVAKCRRLDYEIQNSKAKDSNANSEEFDDDSPSYALNAFSHWTVPCELAIADLATEAATHCRDMPSFPSTRPPDLKAKGSSEFLYDIPSLSEILNESSSSDKELLRIEAAKQEWYSKHSTNINSDSDFLKVFLNRKAIRTDDINTEKVAAAIRSLDHGDDKLARDLNLPIPKVVLKYDST